ncbi:unnamed protein product [Meloidogyne enterolobii]|uniref:Uncharacterized protein n=1 Tax=Meloidogyne enterolobii TaxID=390850 RepID=A0ACB1AMX4_MELEN
MEIFLLIIIFKISAIIRNNLVVIEGRQLGIFDWLKENVKQFALGISEFSIMSGAFFLFNEIGLEKYIATNSSAPYPVYLHFLGQRFYSKMPSKFFFKL